VEIRTEIEIDAPVARVWAVLVDFDGYASWNPFMVRIDGRPEPGAKIAIEIAPPNMKRRVMRERVFAVKPNEELWWGAGPAGIMKGRHFFKLEQLAPGRTRLVHGEEFTGIVVPFVRGLLKNIELGFVACNEALKRHVESG
jgi:hypothetical protein